MSAPREIDRADVLGELLHRFEQDDPPNAIEWVLDTLTELDILQYRLPPLCGATEGATGITCQLQRFHGKDVDHEGTHDPATASHDGVGYRLTVRWPWNEWDRDYPAVQGEEYPEVSGAGVPFPPSESVPGQDLCRQDECPAAPRCSSGATVWHTRTPQCAPPLHVDNEAIVLGEYYAEKAGPS